MTNLQDIFNQVILSYGMQPFTAMEFSSITEIFHNLTEEDIKNLANEYAKELMTYEYETMYR
jgi:hypothetical protein